MPDPRCLPEAELRRDLGLAALGAFVGLVVGLHNKKMSVPLAVVSGSLAGLAYAAYDNATTCTEAAEPAGDTP